MEHIEIQKLLTQQLEKKGIELNFIPRFIKDITISLSDNPSFGLSQVNDYLHSLGWNDIQLDYRICELAQLHLESDSLKNTVS